MKINSSITRGVLTPLFYEDPLYCLPLFQILPTPSFFVASNPQPHSSLSCLVSLVEWVIVPHLMCYFNDIMSSPDILVPEEPWCVIFATRCQVYWGLTHNVLFFWYSDLISQHKHIQTHTVHSGVSRLKHTYKYIFTPPLMCSQQLSLLHWMNNLSISKIYFPQHLFFSKIIHF